MQTIGQKRSPIYIKSVSQVEQVITRFEQCFYV